MTWEYTKTSLKLRGDGVGGISTFVDEDLVRHMNKQGLEGWELVNGQVHQFGNGIEEYGCFWKRPA